MNSELGVLKNPSCELGTRSLKKSEFRVVNLELGVLKNPSSELGTWNSEF